MAELGGEQVLLEVSARHSMASGAAVFHRAYHRGTPRALLEARKDSFHYFQGVFRILRYDYVPGYIIIAQRLTTAVKVIKSLHCDRRGRRVDRSARITRPIPALNTSAGPGISIP